MAKARISFVCTECGGVTAKWEGKCPHCGAWNTLQESRESAAPAHRFAPLAGASPVRRLSEIEAREQARSPTGIPEFDRVLGGGLVQGAVVLIGGDPGIGKSTLLLQAVASMAPVRSEERRVGKECRCRWSAYEYKEKMLEIEVHVTAMIVVSG